MADNDGDVGAFLSGFIIGGLVGAAAALVLAPQSGHETRAQMREKGIELKTRSEDGLQEAWTGRCRNADQGRRDCCGS